jgi:CRP/FNR family transcriptional regulator, cyclic AMP receptor protein
VVDLTLYSEVRTSRPSPNAGSKYVGSLTSYERDQIIFCQGNPADCLYIIQAGLVKMTAVSLEGKEVVLDMPGPGQVIGEASLLENPVRQTTAAAFTQATLLRVSVQRPADLPVEMARMLAQAMAARIAQLEGDLVGSLLYNSEKRLALVLLKLARLPKSNGPLRVVPRISQEVLASMVGTTRSRISFFLRRFEKLGLIRYGRHIELDADRTTDFLTK